MLLPATMWDVKAKVKQLLGICFIDEHLNKTVYTLPKHYYNIIAYIYILF